MRWAPVAGYRGVYEVSDAGAVRRVRAGRGTRAKELVPYSAGAGYLQVGLRTPGSRKKFYVHRLVASAFLGGSPPGKPEVNHKDGDKTNNSVDNLEWVSHSENHKHAYLTGLSGLITRNRERGVAV